MPTRMWPTAFQNVVHTLKALRRGVDTALCGAVAGAYDGALEVWGAECSGAAPSARATLRRRVHIPAAHAGSVSTLGVPRDVYSLRHLGDNLFVSGGTDGKLCIWHVQGDDVQLRQTVDLGGRYPLDAALVCIPGPSDSAEPSVLLAVALTDKRIHLYVRESSSQDFTHRLALQGHEDWVRALDFAVVCADPSHFEVALASGAQDNTVRLWKVGVESGSAGTSSGGTRDTFEAMAADLMREEDGIATKKHYVELAHIRCAVSLDALLLGHDDAVMDVRWCPPLAPQAESPLPPAPAMLLSCALDNSVIVWAPHAEAHHVLGEPDLAQALWLPAHRLGDVGSQSGGFYDAVWAPAVPGRPVGSGVLTHDRQGSAHLWTRAGTRWEPTWAVGGHVGAARGAAWEPLGDYFLTTGADRTTRLHGTYVRRDGDRAWHELARPQVHGYEVQAAAWADRACFVSAADEKVLRVFGAPRNFVESAAALGTFQSQTHRECVLALKVGTLAEWRAYTRLAPAIRTVMQQDPEQALTVLVFAEQLAPLFPEAGGAGAAADVALDDVEKFLQYVYTTAWAVAVEQDALLRDIHVGFIPASPTSQRGVRGAQGWVGARLERPAVYAVDDARFRVPDDVLQLLGGTERTLLPADHTGADAAAAPDPSGPLHGSWPVAGTVALGGTFDHLHIGHKLLLSVAALCAQERLIVGVTSEALLVRKKHREYLESDARRTAAVRGFVHAFRATLAPLFVDAVSISDVCGPAGTEPALQLLVLTDETKSGGETIRKVRAENQVPPIDMYAVSLVDSGGDAAGGSISSKVGSTAIRTWLAERGVPPSGEVRDVQLAAVLADRAAQASVPPLGLSNRAETRGADEAPAGAAAEHAEPPCAEHLQSMTLWLELDKLYGHGYELLSVACNPRTRLTASTCKATTPAHAVVRLFDGAAHWRPLEPPLEGHTLSITRVVISPDAAYLLTASRDRSWRLYQREADGTYGPLAGERAHARIVWDCAWSMRADERVFATASRDKTVKLWRLTTAGERPYEALATLRLADAATCVALGAANELAVGLENGDVLLFREGGGSWTLGAHLPRHHTGAVTQVAFRPQGAWMDAYAKVPSVLLSTGEDGAVRVVTWA